MQVTDMFPARYLRGQDMTKPILVELNGVELTELRAGPDKPAEPAFVLYFKDVSSGNPADGHGIRGLMFHRGKGHALVLRKSLAEEINQATATQDTEQWRGKRVVLYPEQRTVARRSVVSIRARAPKTGQQPTAPAPDNPPMPPSDEAKDES